MVAGVIYRKHRISFLYMECVASSASRRVRRIILSNTCGENIPHYRHGDIPIQRLFIQSGGFGSVYIGVGDFELESLFQSSGIFQFVVLLDISFILQYIE